MSLYTIYVSLFLSDSPRQDHTDIHISLPLLLALPSTGGGWVDYFFFFSFLKLLLPRVPESPIALLLPNFHSSPYLCFYAEVRQEATCVLYVSRCAPHGSVRTFLTNHRLHLIHTYHTYHTHRGCKRGSGAAEKGGSRKFTRAKQGGRGVSYSGDGFQVFCQGIYR